MKFECKNTKKCWKNDDSYGFLFVVCGKMINFAVSFGKKNRIF